MRIQCDDSEVTSLTFTQFNGEARIEIEEDSHVKFEVLTVHISKANAVYLANALLEYASVVVK